LKVPPATVVNPEAVVMLEDNEVPVTPVPGTVNALVAAIVPVPEVDIEAPVPTTIAASVFVLPVIAEKATAAVLDAVIVTSPTHVPATKGVHVMFVPGVIAETGVAADAAIN
jgi:hypothetical protein